MALITPRRLGQLQPMTQSRLNAKRLRSPTLTPSRTARTLASGMTRFLRWMLGERRG